MNKLLMSALLVAVFGANLVYGGPNDPLHHTCYFDSTNLNSVITHNPTFPLVTGLFHNGYQIIFSKDPFKEVSETSLMYSGDDGFDAGFVKLPSGNKVPATYYEEIAKLVCRGDGTCDNGGGLQMRLIPNTSYATITEKIQATQPNSLLRGDQFIKLLGECLP